MVHFYFPKNTSLSQLRNINTFFSQIPWELDLRTGSIFKNYHLGTLVITTIALICDTDEFPLIHKEL